MLATMSTFATPRGVLTSRSGLSKTSPRTAGTVSGGIGLKKNLHPLLHMPRRYIRPDTSSSLSPSPRLNLKTFRDHISAHLLSINSDRRAYIDRLLRHEKPHMDSSNSRLNDHFLERYTATDHVYKHELTGTLHLAPVSARLQGEINRKKALKVNEEIEEVKQKFPPTAAITLTEPGVRCSLDKPWKAFSAVKHLMQMKVPTMFIPQLSELVPRKPYQLGGSVKFMAACREGNVDRVQQLLLGNRWLSLTFDHVKQTGLHWAAKRGHDSLASVLIRAGTFIDSRDCAGRTALFIAARKGHVEVVRVLLSMKANPALRSNAGKSPQAVAATHIVRRLVERAMLLNILLKFAPADKRNEVWEKQGLAYFSTNPEDSDSDSSP